MFLKFVNYIPINHIVIVNIYKKKPHKYLNPRSIKLNSIRLTTLLN